MGLVRRGNTLCYYWSTRWFGEVRTTRYGIPGVPGFALEIAEDVRRLRRKVTRSKAKRLAKAERKKRALAEADRAITAWRRDVEARVAAVLEPLGYDRRHRHGWRKRRMTTPSTTMSKPPVHATAMLARHPAPSVPALPPLPGDLGPLVALATAGDEEAAHLLERQLKADPRSFAGLATEGMEGEVFAAEAIGRALELLGTDAHGRARVELELRTMRERLERQHPTALERLLITQILVTWAHLQSAETARAEAGDANPEWRKIHDKRVDQARRMHLHAIKSLAQVGRLRLPKVTQINLAAPGGQQVNVAAQVAR
jgi:hypothetical protein